MDPMYKEKRPKPMIKRALLSFFIHRATCGFSIHCSGKKCIHDFRTRCTETGLTWACFDGGGLCEVLHKEGVFLEAVCCIRNTLEVLIAFRKYCMFDDKCSGQYITAEQA
eukprot:gnl/MRDRNA2_/MRDRNA2_178170_c0_seq1.p2 gnl/MRDRNA2_/MRDRNA2_178170_c0~~gnl/MRDRNA2_/MRDRNA2_178170_c0_seq1.p2  ORF type:complete len:110 (+),score=16.44 gnl/MRDRNA2_/MRDRNA2_178170_c0_seq1:622-951(+)